MNPQRLRHLRKNQQLNQRELAQALEISTSAIGMYEQGRREPDHETLMKLARFFDVSVDYLMDNESRHHDQTSDELADELFKNLMDQNALMFRAENLTEQDYAQLTKAIKVAVDITMKRERKQEKK